MTINNSESVELAGSEWKFTKLADFRTTGLVRTVVSISHCGCDDPGSIPGLDSMKFVTFLRW